MTTMAANDSGSIVLVDSKITQGDTILFDLLVSVGDDHVAALLFKHAEKLIAALEYYPIKPNESNNAALFNEIAEKSILLSETGYRKVACLSAFRSNTLVPNPLFTDHSATKQLPKMLFSQMYYTRLMHIMCMRFLSGLILF